MTLGIMAGMTGVLATAMAAATTTPEIRFDWRVPVVLAAVLAASGVTYALLVRRWTTQRLWLALSDWAEANKFTLAGEQRAKVPEVVKLLTQPAPRVLLSLHDPDTTIVQVETPLTPGASPTSPAAAATQRPARWNLLVRDLAVAWPMTGLRPQGHHHSILDFFPLSDMQAMSPSERFVLYGAEASAARALAKSLVRGLLPPDVSLLLVGHSLVIDFSARPMDPLTLQRIDTLAEQLVTHLPARSA